jgi:hypothetical protein
VVAVELALEDAAVEVQLVGDRDPAMDAWVSYL